MWFLFIVAEAKLSMDNVTKIMRLLHASSFSDLHSEMTGSACVGGYSIYQNKTSIAYIAYVTKMQKKGKNDRKLW